VRYEVIEQHKGETRVITTTRRENGAANERDIAAQSAYQNARKHAEAEGRVVWGEDPKDPHAVIVAYFTDNATVTWTYTYRPVGSGPDSNPDLTDVLLASIVALTAGSR
jgi:hypothetical protein